MKPEVKTEIWLYVKVLTVTLFFSIVLQHFFFQPYTVKGESMMPTLHEGNKIIIGKLSKPDRFDLVVLKAPFGDDFLVKRVIGLPGEEVEYKDDVLYVNGKPLKEPHLNEYRNYLSAPDQLTEDFSVEDVSLSKRIPANHILVLGDNRLVSRDGRHFGVTPIDDVVGEVHVTYWPIDELKVVK